MSTRGTPIAGSPSRSMIVFGMEAWECHWASMPWLTFPPNISSGMREPPMAAKPSGWSASGRVSIDGVGHRVGVAAPVVPGEDEGGVRPAAPVDDGLDPVPDQVLALGDVRRVGHERWVLVVAGRCPHVADLRQRAGLGHRDEVLGRVDVRVARGRSSGSCRTSSGTRPGRGTPPHETPAASATREDGRQVPDRVRADERRVLHRRASARRWRACDRAWSWSRSRSGGRRRRTAWPASCRTGSRCRCRPGPPAPGSRPSGSAPRRSGRAAGRSSAAAPAEGRRAATAAPQALIVGK